MSLRNKSFIYLEGFEIPSKLYLGPHLKGPAMLEYFTGIRDASIKMVEVLKEEQTIDLLKGETNG